MKRIDPDDQISSQSTISKFSSIGRAPADSRGYGYGKQIMINYTMKSKIFYSTSTLLILFIS